MLFGFLGVLYLSTDKKECELKLQKLFSFKNFSSYFDKLENTNYILEKFTQSKNDFFINSDNMNEIIFLLLDNLIEFEYFHSFGLKQDGYDYLKLKSRYEEIKKFIPNSDNTKPNYPTHPSIIYRDTLTQISKYKMPKDDIENLLKIIFEVDKKPKMPKTHKKELYQMVTIFEDMKQSLINSPELNEGYYDKSENEKKEALLDLDTKIKKYKAKINS